MSKILDDLTIGNDPIVGANVIVIHDVPDKSVVVDVSAFIIKFRDDVSKRYGEI